MRPSSLVDHYLPKEPPFSRAQYEQGHPPLVLAGWLVSLPVVVSSHA